MLFSQADTLQHPPVRAYLFDGRSLVGLNAEHPCYKFASVHRDAVEHRINPSRDFLVELPLRHPLEGVVSAQHEEQDHTQRPNVRLEPIIVLFLHDFRGHVRRGPAEDLQTTVLGSANTEAEVDKLYVIPLINNNVLELEVPVADVLVVKCADGLAELSEEDPGLLLGQNPFGALKFDVLVQADAGDEFLNQIDVLPGLEVIIEFHDVRVVDLQALHAGDLSLHGLPLGGVIQFVLGIDFDGHFLLRLLVLGQLHIGIGPGTEVSDDEEIVQFGGDGRILKGLGADCKQA